MPRVGVEPTRVSSHDFESCASASSATAACSNGTVFSMFFQAGTRYTIHIVYIKKVWYHVYMANFFGELDAFLGGSEEKKPEAVVNPPEESVSVAPVKPSVAENEHADNGSLKRPHIEQETSTTLLVIRRQSALFPRLLILEPWKLG